MEHPDPLVAPLVELLSRRFPEAPAFEDLRRALGAGAAETERALWAAVDADLVALHVHAPVYAAAAGERPRASALARLQARAAIDVTSLRHENVRMEEPAARLLLELLDGTRDRAALRADLAVAGGPDLPPDALEASLADLGALGLLHEGSVSPRCGTSARSGCASGDAASISSHARSPRPCPSWAG